MDLPDGAVADPEAGPGLPPASITITLREPLTSAGNVTTEQITLREPTLGELDEAMIQPTIVKQMMSLISKIGGLPSSAVKTMKVSDYNACRDYFLGFINASAPNT